MSFSVYLLFLSKYLAYASICGSFMHNGDGRPLLLFIYSIKYLCEPLLTNESFLDNAVLLISALAILIYLS